ncbi:MAG: SGNH hydrolase domain-containing protein [Pirellulaceae bacterium]
MIETPTRRWSGRALRNRCLVSLVHSDWSERPRLESRGGRHSVASPGDRPGVAAALESKSHLFEMNAEVVNRRRMPRFAHRESDFKILVWGDSHAMALMPGIVAAAKQHDAAVIQATHSATAPLVGFVSEGQYALRDQSPAFAESVVGLCQDEQIDVVILAANWERYAKSQEFGPRLEQTVAELRATGAAVWFVNDVPWMPIDMPHTLGRQAFWNQPIEMPFVTNEEYTRRNAHTLAALTAESLSDLVIVDPLPSFEQPDGHYHGYIDNEVLYRDKNHLTIAGMNRLAPLFATQLANHRQSR